MIYNSVAIIYSAKMFLFLKYQQSKLINLRLSLPIETFSIPLLETGKYISDFELQLITGFGKRWLSFWILHVDHTLFSTALGLDWARASLERSGLLGWLLAQHPNVVLLDPRFDSDPSTVLLVPIVKNHVDCWKCKLILTNVYWNIILHCFFGVRKKEKTFDVLQRVYDPVQLVDNICLYTHH